MRRFLQRVAIFIHIGIIRVRMCPVTQQREFGMIARRIIHDQAKPLEASSTDIIIPIRVAIIHEEVLINIEVFGCNSKRAFLFGFAIVQTNNIALGIFICTCVIITVANGSTFFILNLEWFIFIGISSLQLLRHNKIT